MLSTKEDIMKAIEQDVEMMTILKAVKSLDLPDCWVCAGFVRTKIWDTLHGLEKTPLPDIDVIYLNHQNTAE